MKKILLTIFTTIFCFHSINTSHAFVRYEEKKPKNKIELKVGGFIDYEPFGWNEGQGKMERFGFHTVFKPLLDLFESDANVEIDREYAVKDVDEMVQKVREGKIDFFVGAYNETEIFRGLHLIYPAVLYNPITVFMLPNRVSEVKSTEDLKKLKGIRNVNELFSDFVNKKIAEYNPIEVNSAEEAFKKLYNREADYLISSYYNGMIEAVKLGVENQIAPAKQTLWRIPLFIGVSKTSQNRNMISKRITKYLTDKNNIKAVEQNLQAIINDFQKRYEGVVATSFIQDNTKTEQSTTSDNAENSIKAE